jgi:ubiquinone biosynthesis protein UbiJ
VDPLERLLRPLARLVNESIRETTPARELAAELDGTVAAIRVRDTALAMYFRIEDGALAMSGDTGRDPDIVISGSLPALTRLAATGDDDAIRSGAVDLLGDAGKAARFQKLLRYAKPDIEEQASRIIGDTAANQLGKAVRGFGRWARDARDTMRGNVREYLQEESRDVPSRYEVERFARRVNSLRDDTDRLEARIRRLDGKRS